MTTHHSIVPLEGGINFRDFGGFLTHDGRRVVRGQLFRSGSPHKLTEKDFRTLQEMGITTAFDLRDNNEREKTPAGWTDQGIESMEWDYSMHEASFRTFFAHGPPSMEALSTFMQEFYRGLPERFGPKFKDIVERLLKQPEQGLVIHCTAGKDRTGFTVALMLTALGVPRETIVGDYHLTESVLPPAALLKNLVERSEPGDSHSWAFLQEMPDSVVNLLLGAPKVMINAALEQLDAQYGDSITWMNKALSISAGDISRLREAFTEATV